MEGNESGRKVYLKIDELTIGKEEVEETIKVGKLKRK